MLSKTVLSPVTKLGLMVVHVMYVGSSNNQVRISDGSKFDCNNATGRGGVISTKLMRVDLRF